VKSDPELNPEVSVKSDPGPKRSFRIRHTVATVLRSRTFPSYPDVNGYRYRLVQVKDGKGLLCTVLTNSVADQELFCSDLDLDPTCRVVSDPELMRI